MSAFDKNECVCIGCGCTDSEPCNHGGNFCNWIRIDRDIGMGVCSHCQLSADHWDALRQTGGTMIVENDQAPECPHCQTVVHGWQGNQALLDGERERTTLRCTKCRSTFHVWSNITYHFCSGAVGGVLREVKNVG